MRLAVRHEHLAGRADEDAMRARKTATAGGAIRTITPLTSTHNRRDPTRFQLDSPDDMVFRVGKIEAVVRRPRNAFRPREPRRLCETSIAGIAGLARARNMIDSSGYCIEAVHRVPLAAPDTARLRARR